MCDRACVLQREERLCADPGVSVRKGFADIVFLPLPHTDKPAIIVELKYDGTADAAIQQIKDRQYVQALEGYSGEVLLVGINYNRDDKDKPHSCAIEKCETGGRRYGSK